MGDEAADRRMITELMQYAGKVRLYTVTNEVQEGIPVCKKSIYFSTLRINCFKKANFIYKTTPCK